eukprot:1219534-Amphidinium_carterae.1
MEDILRIRKQFLLNVAQHSPKPKVPDHMGLFNRSGTLLNVEGDDHFVILKRQLLLGEQNQSFTIFPNKTWSNIRTGALLDTEGDHFDYIWIEDWNHIRTEWRELADLGVLHSLSSPCFVTWRRRKPVNNISYNPRTLYNCLFMSLSKELKDIGIHTSPAALRFAVKQQWLAGSTVLGAGGSLTTCGYRWGSAPDAMLACKLLNVNLLIVSGNDILVRQCARSELWVVLHLHNQHYSVASRSTISTSAFHGRNQYWVADQKGMFVNISHFSQFTSVLPSTQRSSRA